MNFSVGDKVIFINEKLRGMIIDIKNDILVVNCSKLDFEINKSKIIKISEDVESMYSKLTVNDQSLVISENDDPIQYKDKQDSSIELKVNISKNFELDLHLEKIIENLENVNHQEILQLQMNAFYRGIFEAKNLGIDYLIIIHGIGKGILKRKIIEFLEENQAVFSDADYIKYKGGAIKIKIN